MNTQKHIDDYYEKPTPVLRPGEEICDCGRIREVEERRRCVNCHEVGCAACMHTVAAGDDCAEDNWVCGIDTEVTCEVEWLEYCQKADTQTFTRLQDYLGKQIEEARHRADVRRITRNLNTHGYAVMEDGAERGNGKAKGAAA